MVYEDRPQPRRGPQAAQPLETLVPLTEQELHLGVWRRALLETRAGLRREGGQFVLRKSHVM